MILQTDKKLNKSINEYGCYFMAIIFCVFSYLKKNKKNTVNEVNDGIVLYLYNRCVNLGIMRSDCYVLKPIKIFVECFMYLSSDDFEVPNIQFISFNDDIKKMKSNITNIKDKKIIGCISKWSWKFSHFVVSDINNIESKEVLYDGLGDSKSVENGSIVGFRIFYIN